MNYKIGMRTSYKIGDVLYNPFYSDLWIVSERYNEEKEKDELYLKKIDYDYDEEIDVPLGFMKIGNIYELLAPIEEEQKYVWTRMR